MNIAVVTNHNGIGLTRDWELLRDFLLKRGHSVVSFQFDAPIPENVPKHDLVIFLEVIPRNMLDLAPVRFFFANPEWCKPDIIQTARRSIDRIFAKTFEGQRKLREIFEPERVHYVGFLTRDQLIDGVKKKPWFLNIGGNSSMRGTRELLDAWKWKKNGHQIEARLHVISSLDLDIKTDPHIFWWKYLPEEDLKILQNECLFHIYPTGTEGFGHAIHESLSAGAVLLLTDAPPMNEIHSGMKMPAAHVGKYHLSDVYEVSALDIFDSVQLALERWPEPHPEHTAMARNEFLKDNEEFEKLFGAHIDELEKTGPAIPVRSTPVPRATGSLRIAFIGNFKATESTENMVRIALEETLGHEVEMLQENEINFAAVKNAAHNSDMLLWVRTPNWLNVMDHQMNDLMDQLRGKHIPTVSMHLDKFFGIPEREALIGKIPFWNTQFVFTADGSPAAAGFFKARGVNHIWMKPAVSEMYCHPGRAWDMYRCDVGFVGAKDYHFEYPFRRELVEWLEKQYVGRFRHITDLRGHGLNDFYASCSVVVGDCIFAGTPRYFSDRLPETTGRFGFLLHPKVEGIDIPVALYRPQDLNDLQEQIEYWLPRKQERKERIRQCAEHVRLNDTWDIRLQEILDLIERE